MQSGITLHDRLRCDRRCRLGARGGHRGSESQTSDLRARRGDRAARGAADLEHELYSGCAHLRRAAAARARDGHALLRACPSQPDRRGHRLAEAGSRAARSTCAGCSRAPERCRSRHATSSASCSIASSTTGAMKPGTCCRRRAPQRSIRWRRSSWPRDPSSCSISLMAIRSSSRRTRCRPSQEGAHYAPVEAFGSPDAWQTVKPGQTGARARRARGGDTRPAARHPAVAVARHPRQNDRCAGGSRTRQRGSHSASSADRSSICGRCPSDELARIGARLTQERPGLPFPLQAAGQARTTRRFVVEDDVDGVKVLTIRRPEALNALHDEINDELLEAIRQHADDPAVRGFVDHRLRDARIFCWRGHRTLSGGAR